LDYLQPDFFVWLTYSKTRVEFQNGIYQSPKSTINEQYNGQKITMHTIIYNTKPQ
jgi:hypothetical protein